jgi:hypothetical protein
MRRHQLARHPTVLVMICALGGCARGPTPESGAANADYSLVDFLVVDGETGKPIKGAKIHSPGQWGTSTRGGTTDARGHARLWAATWVSDPWAEADGYLTAPSCGPPNERRSIRFALFHPPEPLAGLSIPSGFRGVLRVSDALEQPRPPEQLPAPWPRGQREFYTRVVEVNGSGTGNGGITRLQAPPKLYDGHPYDPCVYVAQFDDGTALRFENPIARTGWDGENIYNLPNIRDRVPPRADGVALFQLGARSDFAAGRRAANYALYFVGTLDQAAAEQQRLIAGAIPRSQLAPATTLPAGGYEFSPTPLSAAGFPQSTELSPRQSTSKAH